jgi:hypothetical protein
MNPVPPHHDPRQRAEAAARLSLDQLAAVYEATQRGSRREGKSALYSFRIPALDGSAALDDVLARIESHPERQEIIRRARALAAASNPEADVTIIGRATRTGRPYIVHVGSEVTLIARIEGDPPEVHPVRWVRRPQHALAEQELIARVRREYLAHRND